MPRRDDTVNHADLSTIAPGPRTTASCDVRSVADGQALPAQDVVIAEVPVALVFNGVSHAVMMATPADLEDFALGFALTEGIIESAHEIYDCEVQERPQGVEVQLEISAQRFAGLKERRRNLAGRTGCGLCGVDSLDAVARDLRPLPARSAVAASAVARALGELPTRQPLFTATGAAHAAAWCDRDGALRCVREDVGRHNALDKLIGHLVRTQADAGDGFCVVTSRASYEMVQKTVAFGAGLLVAVSAPTSRAVALATQYGMGLAGFARGRQLTVYAHPDRLSATD